MFFGKCWFFFFYTMEIFFENSKLPLVLYRLGPRRFCTRGSFSEYVWRVGNSDCNVYINHLSRLPTQLDLRTVLVGHDTGSQYTLHRWYKRCQCNSITPHRYITPQDAAFNEEYRAWIEQTRVYEELRATRRAEKKTSNKRHRGRLTKPGQIPRHPQHAESVSTSAIESIAAMTV